MSYTLDELKAMYAGRSSVTPADDVVGHHLRLRSDMSDFRAIRRFENYMNHVKAEQSGKGSTAVKKHFNRLFYPATSASELGRLFSGELFRARTYQVTSEMVDAVSEAYEKTAELIGHFKEEEVPFEAGFVWLDKPFLMTDRWGRVMAVRVVTWSTQTVLVDAGHGNVVPVVGIRLSAWHHVDDPDAYWQDGQLDREMPRGPSGFVICITCLVTVGERFGGNTSFQAGENDAATTDDFARWVHVLWCLMEMEVAHEAPLTRPAQRRARSLKRPPKTVNVITLRRTAPGLADEDRWPGSRTVEWTCQWLVQPFYRHEDLSYRRQGIGNHKAIPGLPDRGTCAICGQKITWVKSHTRGPKHLPVRSPAQLYRLER